MNIKKTLACALALAFPVANAAVEVPPNKDIPRIKLGGHRMVATNQLELISKFLLPCTSAPFRAEEFSRVAAGSIKSVPVMMRNGQSVLTQVIALPARNDKAARTVPLAQYVNEINAAEKFFNEHGYTLRHGPLSLKPAGRPGPIRAGTCAERDTGPGMRDSIPLIRYRLVDAPEQPSKKNALDRHIELPITKPNRPGPGDVMDPVFQPGVSLLKHPELTSAGKLLAKTTLVDIPGWNGVRGMPRRRVMSGCPAVCTSHLEDGSASLTEGAKILLANPDEVAYNEYKCKVGGASVAECPELQLETLPMTHRKWWNKFIDVNFFLANWNKPCEVIEHEKKLGHNPAHLYNYSEQAGGEGTIIVGEAAKTFFDGTLGLEKKMVKDCVVDFGSSSMFGAQFCLVYNTANSFTPANGFNIHNDAGLKTDVSLFGYTFDLLSGSANIDWLQAVKPEGMVAVNQPAVKSTLEQVIETQHYEGPGATFPIGPVPLTVRTFADASLNVGHSVTEFIPPPLVKDNPAIGRVGMGVGASTDVSLGMDAAIDAFVLSAGISGKMSLLNNSVDGSIVSIIAPAANDLTVKKGYKFAATTMKGSISAFVEIDLIVYSERYSVDIIKFAGKTQTFEPEKSQWGPAHAVIPSSAQPTKVCK